MDNKRTFNDVILTVISFSMIINVVVASALFSVALIGDSENRLADFIKDVNTDFYKVCFLVAGAVSIVGLAIAVCFFTKLSELNKISIAESLLNEEKEKYKKATEEFVKLTKVNSIN